MDPHKFKREQHRLIATSPSLKRRGAAEYCNTNALPKTTLAYLLIQYMRDSDVKLPSELSNPMSVKML
jgi:hypothetical protein